MISTAIVDGFLGTESKLKVYDEGEIGVAIHQHPPKNETDPTRPFRQRFSDDGTATGTTSMIVDGSSTNVDYYIEGNKDYDIYIRTISVQISDTGTVDLDKFGALTALSNGVEFEWSSDILGTVTLHDGIKTNLEFIRLGTLTAGVGGGTSAFQSDTSGAGNTTYLPIIDLAQLHGLQWGIRLRRGTNERLTFRIRDNMTGMTVFDAIGYGIRI